MVTTQQKTISATLLRLVWNNNTVALLRSDRETNRLPRQRVHG
jgi:hypothetical protein